MHDSRCTRFRPTNHRTWDPQYQFQIHECSRLSLYHWRFVDYIKSGNTFVWETFKDEVLLDTLLGRGMYHMWFLPMILGLYVLTPLLKEMVRSRELCEYFLILYFLFNLLYNTLFKFQIPYATIMKSLFTRLPLKMLEGYIGYYVLGYYLDRYLKQIKKSSLSTITGQIQEFYIK